MDTDGNGFFTSWDDFRSDLKTQEFKDEFDNVINALRFDEQYGGVLKNRRSLSSYCYQHTESGFDANYCTEYAFRADTAKYAYVFRLNPTIGDYNLYCYCYVRDWLDQHITQAERGIRFITPDYKEVFRIPDGDQVRITMRLEPTDDEMNPPPEPEKEYRISLGDTVHLGAQEYEVLALGDTTVRLYDPAFPLFNKELAREEFDNKLQENPFNDHFLHTVEPQQAVQEQKKLAEKESSGNPVWDEYRSLKAQNPEAVLLYQLGDFFIVLGDDAELVSKALELSLTNRALNANERIPMCGFPASRLNTYTDMLTDRGYGVVIADLDGETRETKIIPSQHKETPIDSIPVGRIEFLGSNGTVGETVKYIDGDRFVKDIKDENYYGSPMFKETADIQTADMLNLPVPKANYHNVVLKPSPQQAEMVASLAERAERVRNRMGVPV